MTEFDRGQFGEAIRKFDSSSDFPPMEERRKAWESADFLTDEIKSSNRRIVVTLLAGLALVGGGYHMIFGQNGDAERTAVERCVGELTGREVTIPRDGLGELQHPKVVYDEQLACERNDNDPSIAQQNIRHIPLAE